MAFSYRALLTLIATLVFAIPGVAQAGDTVDPLAFFDANKRWYRGDSAESWFNFFDIPESDVRKSLEHWERIGRDLGDSRSGGYRSGGATHGTYVRWSE